MHNAPWVSPERANLHLATCHGAHRVYHDGEEGLLVLLVQHLQGRVNRGVIERASMSYVPQGAEAGNQKHQERAGMSSACV